MVADHDAVIHTVAQDLAGTVASDLQKDSGVSAKLTGESTPKLAAKRNVDHGVPDTSSDEQKEKVKSSHEKILAELQNDEQLMDRLSRIGIY